MVDRFKVRTAESQRVVVARLKNGSDLLGALQSIAEEKGIRAGVFLSGVGLLGEARIRNCKSLPEEFPITDANRTFTHIKKPLEILALSGTISITEGKPLVHAHLTLSGVEGDEITVIGGHLIEGCTIFGFAEIALMELGGIEMTKSFDEETQTLQLFA
ncbi:MAG: DNA-binding protein [Candidatus Bathyarchaeota archaeon]|jgi:predicted DNA-binding protein with PD1-like motif